MEAVFFLGVFGVAPGLSAYLLSGPGGGRVLALAWLLVVGFGALMHFAPQLVGALDDAGAAKGRAWVGFAATAVFIGQAVGAKAKGKASQPAIGAGVATLGLAIGTALIGFGVI
jgi:hypothetical protein